MNYKILETFDPLISGWGPAFWLGTVAALLAGAGLWYLLSGRPEHWSSNRRMLVAMLVFFVLMIAGGTAFFSGWAQLKKVPVVFYEEQMETPYGMLPYVDIQRVYFEVDQQTAPFNPNIKRGEPVRFLMISGREDQSVALSERDYPVDSIAATLNQVLQGK